MLINGTLPAGEIQRSEAQEITYGFTTTEFTENVKFHTIYENRHLILEELKMTDSSSLTVNLHINFKRIQVV